jgi:hypothetical protein
LLLLFLRGHLFLQTLGQLVVVSLKLVVELDQVHEVFEVLHEFLVIDAAVAINVSHHVKSECLLLGQVEFSELFEALLVFLPL